MQIDLTQKSILLGVTGSISAYKACDIARLLIKAGANVHVIMTPAAERFVSPLTFEALTRNPVLTQTSESWSSTLNHIDIGKVCDLFVIAPATANTLNKLSQGIADNILTQTVLAFNKEILIAPAANTQMLENHYTLQSLKHLKGQNYTLIEPQEKLLACGDRGNGALAEPLEIFFAVARALLKKPFWEERPVIITGGGSREKIDEVRYISNFSSGKMAKALSLALYLRGANVHYISSMHTDEIPLAIEHDRFEDANSLLTLTKKALKDAKKDAKREPYLFMVAAVADFAPESSKKGKIKKSSIGESWDIKLVQTPDILSSLDKSGIKTIGFKAEMDTKLGLENAKRLLSQKDVDAVCYNLLKDAKSFGGDENEITLITKNALIPLGRWDKLTLSFKLIDEIAKINTKVI